jgi:hypothetical protein
MSPPPSVGGFIIKNLCFLCSREPLVVMTQRSDQQTQKFSRSKEQTVSIWGQNGSPIYTERRRTTEPRRSVESPSPRSDTSTQNSSNDRDTRTRQDQIESSPHRAPRQPPYLPSSILSPRLSLSYTLTSRCKRLTTLVPFQDVTQPMRSSRDLSEFSQPSKLTKSSATKNQSKPRNLETWARWRRVLF